MANTINKIIRNWTEYEIKDTTYTAGTGISIDSNNVISNTQTSAEWWNITGTLSDQTDLNNALAWKQDELTLPANPTQWNLVTWWADNETLVDGGAVPTGFNPDNAWTVDQILTKKANWYEWSNAPVSGIQCDPNSPITITKIRCWTESQYSNLWTYNSTTAYMTV